MPHDYIGNLFLSKLLLQKRYLQPRDNKNFEETRIFSYENNRKKLALFHLVGKHILKKAFGIHQVVRLSGKRRCRLILSRPEHAVENCKEVDFSSVQNALCSKKCPQMKMDPTHLWFWWNHFLKILICRN